MVKIGLVCILKVNLACLDLFAICFDDHILDLASFLILDELHYLNLFQRDLLTGSADGSLAGLGHIRLFFLAYALIQSLIGGRVLFGLSCGLNDFVNQDFRLIISGGIDNLSADILCPFSSVLSGLDILRKQFLGYSGTVLAIGELALLGASQFLACGILSSQLCDGSNILGLSKFDQSLLSGLLNLLKVFGSDHLLVGCENVTDLHTGEVLALIQFALHFLRILAVRIKFKISCHLLLSVCLVL